MCVAFEVDSNADLCSSRNVIFGIIFDVVFGVVLGSFFDVIVDHFLESFLGSFLVVQMGCSFISTFRVASSILDELRLIEKNIHTG